MKKVKHILAIFIVLSILSGAAFIFQKSEFSSRFFAEEKAVAEQPVDTIAVQDTTPFLDRFQQHLEVLQSSYSKRKNQYVWTLGKGRTITYYLLQAQRFLKKNGGKVLYMEEIHDNPSVFQAAQLIATNPDGDTLRFSLQVSESIFRDNASYLSVAFQVTTLTPELIVALNELDYPFDLLVTPFGVSKEFFPDLDRVKNKELILWLLMESPNLDARHKRMRPLRIHHTEEQIESIITEAKNLVPSAKGIATRLAEHAVEHKQLLNTILKNSKQQGLWFTDLSQNNKSIVLDVCKDIPITCKAINPYNPSNSSLDDYIKQKLRGAARNGVSAMIIPLTKQNMEKVKALKSKATNQGTTIVNLSTFMKY